MEEIKQETEGLCFKNLVVTNNLVIIAFMVRNGTLKRPARIAQKIGLS